MSRSDSSRRVARGSAREPMRTLRRAFGRALQIAGRGLAAFAMLIVALGEWLADASPAYALNTACKAWTILRGRST